MDGKKPGLIDCTKRNWENSCSLCFLQVMRLIRGARIITNFRGSFPAVGDRPCRQIFFGNYNRGLYCLPMPIHSAFSFSGPDFRQFDRDLRCTPAGDEDVRPAAGIKNVRFLPDMPEIHRSICQGSLLLDDPIRRISVSGLELCCNCQLMASAHRTHFHTKTIATSAHLVFAPIQSRSNFIV